jgi:hypothetical protein
MLQYYLHISHPEELPDDEWAAKFRLLEYIRNKEKEGTGPKI